MIFTRLKWPQTRQVGLPQWIRSNIKNKRQNSGFMKEKRMDKNGGVLGWEFQLLMA